VAAPTAFMPSAIRAWAWSAVWRLLRQTDRFGRWCRCWSPHWHLIGPRSAARVVSVMTRRAARRACRQNSGILRADLADCAVRR